MHGHGEWYDAICVRQPTSPLCSTDTIDRCISSLWEREVDDVVSVRPVPTEFNPHWVYFQSDDGLLRPSMGEGDPIPSRQELPAAYHHDGSVFVARTQVVISGNPLYGARVLGVVLPPAEATDLDTEERWNFLSGV